MALFALGAPLVGAALVVTGCVSDASPMAEVPADGSAGTDAPSSPPPDAGEELIADGGGVPVEDPDAGLDDDAGVDAGPACGSVATGVYATSTCNSHLINLTGGDLTTTTYELKSVADLGSLTFCANAFAPYSHRGGLKVSATSTSTATFEFTDQYRKPASIYKPTTLRYDAEVVASGGLLAYTSTACSLTSAPTKGVSYFVGTDNGKKLLILKLPYGTGSALYRFVEP